MRRALEGDAALAEEDGALEQLDEIGPRPGDRLDRRQRRSPSEDRETPKEPLLLGIEELVASLDRGAKRALALRHVSAARHEQGEAAVEPFEEQLRLENPDPGGGELDRKRQSVEPLADLDGSGRSRYSRSADTRSGSRLVASTLTVGHAPTSSAT